VIKLIVFSALLAVSSCAIPIHSKAFDNGQYKDVDPKVRAWFKGIRSPNGVPCCDVADGHSTIWRQSKTEGHEFDVPIEGVWVPVPDEVIVRNSHNPTGETIVWYTKQYQDQGAKNWYIRCFVLGSGA
jgi:hypothetical protein